MIAVTLEPPKATFSQAEDVHVEPLAVGMM
jgi:hypothetical protein